MKKQIETLRAEVLDLQKRSIQYNILKREVDTNRTLYEGLLQRYQGSRCRRRRRRQQRLRRRQGGAAEVPRPRPICHARCCSSLALGLGAGAGRCLSCSSTSTTPCNRARRSSAVTGLATLGIIPKVSGC